MGRNLLTPACLQQDRLASEVVWREAGLMLKELEPVHGLLEVSVQAAAVPAPCSSQAALPEQLPGPVP